MDPKGEYLIYGCAYEFSNNRKPETLIHAVELQTKKLIYTFEAVSQGNLS